MSIEQGQLSTWFSERGFKPKHLRWEYMNDGMTRVVFSTTKNNYFVRYSDRYLGLTVSSRLSRPGETWNRGNDLHDGEFSEDTFTLMLKDVLRYELREVSTEEGNSPWSLLMGV